jgi:hypothetical protein
MKRAKHKYSIPAKHFRELIFLNIIFSGLGAAGTYAFNWGSGFLNTMAAIGLGLSLLVWIAGAVRRKNTTLVAEMNDSTWSIRVWMHKPIQFWKATLTPMSNVIQLDNVTDAYVKDMNGNTTLVLRNDKELAKSFYIPQRLALVPDVAKFFNDFLESKDGKKMKAKARNVIKDFLENDFEEIQHNKELEPSSSVVANYKTNPFATLAIVLSLVGYFNFFGDLNVGVFFAVAGLIMSVIGYYKYATKVTNRGKGIIIASTILSIITIGQFFIINFYAVN